MALRTKCRNIFPLLMRSPATSSAQRFSSALLRSIETRNDVFRPLMRPPATSSVHFLTSAVPRQIEPRNDAFPLLTWPPAVHRLAMYSTRTLKEEAAIKFGATADNDKILEFALEKQKQQLRSEIAEMMVEVKKLNEMHTAAELELKGDDNESELEKNLRDLILVVQDGVDDVNAQAAELEMKDNDKYCSEILWDEEKIMDSELEKQLQQLRAVIAEWLVVLKKINADAAKLLAVEAEKMKLEKSDEKAHKLDKTLGKVIGGMLYLYAGSCAIVLLSSYHEHRGLA